MELTKAGRKHPALRWRNLDGIPQLDELRYSLTFQTLSDKFRYLLDRSLRSVELLRTFRNIASSYSALLCTIAAPEFLNVG